MREETYLVNCSCGEQIQVHVASGTKRKDVANAIRGWVGHVGHKKLFKSTSTPEEFEVEIK